MTQFKDKFAKRGYAKPVDKISFAQVNHNKIRFMRDHYRKAFLLTLDDGRMVLISEKNANKLARWILEFTDGGAQGELARTDNKDGTVSQDETKR